MGHPRQSEKVKVFLAAQCCSTRWRGGQPGSFWGQVRAARWGRSLGVD